MNINRINKKNIETDSPRQEGVQSIRRTIDLLRMIAKYNDHGVNLSKIARKVGLHTTTVHRILAVLVEEGLVTFDPGSRCYHLGIDLYYLGASAHQFHLRDRFHHILERIAEKTEDTAYMAIRSGYDALVIDRVEGAFHIKTLIQEVGERVPLGIGAGSTTLLASLPQKEMDSIIQINAKRYGQYNNRTSEDVREQVFRCKEKGYSVSESNIIPGATAVGMPILDLNGTAVASVSVSAIAKRMGQNRIKKITVWLKSEIASIVSLPDGGELESGTVDTD